MICALSPIDRTHDERCRQSQNAEADEKKSDETVFFDGFAEAVRSGERRGAAAVCYSRSGDERIAKMAKRS